MRRAMKGAIFSRVDATNASGAERGDPHENGGSGSYSIWSWISSATSSPNNSATTVSAKSIPEVTPAPVIRSRSFTTRSATGTAPSSSSWSIEDQWQVAR